MEHRFINGTCYIRLDRGDELIGSLLTIAGEEGLSLARVHGIGGCSSATVGVFDPEKREYEKKTVTGMLEMLSLEGNLTEYEDKPYLHVHASFAYREDGEIRLLAGHLLEAVIGLTGEITLTPEEGHIGRKMNEELGIRIWDFDRTENRKG